MDHHTPRSGLRSQPQPQKQTREIRKAIGRFLHKFNIQSRSTPWWLEGPSVTRSSTEAAIDRLREPHNRSAPPPSLTLLELSAAPQAASHRP